MNNNDDIFAKLLIDNEMDVKDISTYSKMYAENKEELQNAINNIVSLNEDLSKGVDITEFLSGVNRKCNNIRKILNDNPVLDTKASPDMHEFYDRFNDFTKNFSIYNGYLNAQLKLSTAIENEKNAQKMYDEFVEKYSKVDITNLSQEEKEKYTTEASIVGANLNVTKETLKNAQKEYDEQKRMLNESVKKFKFKDYKKKLLEEVEFIKGYYEDLSKEQKEILDKDFNDLVVFVNDFGKALEEKEANLNELCSKYGVALNKVSEIELIINDADVNSKDKTIDDDKKVITVDELVSDLESLNPDVEFELDGIRLNSTESIDKLNIPDYAKVDGNKIVVGMMSLEIMEKEIELTSGSVHTVADEEVMEELGTKFEYPSVITKQNENNLEPTPEQNTPGETNSDPGNTPELPVENTPSEPDPNEPIFHDPELDNEDSDTKDKNELYWKSMQKVAAFAGGTVVGLGASAVVSVPTITGLGVIRIGYSAVKFGNKMYSKYALDGGETKIDKVIKNFKNKANEKFEGNKVYETAKRINAFLKKPEVQWFLNGVAVGYTVGSIVDLKGKLNNALNKETQIETSTQDVGSSKRTDGTVNSSADADTIDVPEASAEVTATPDVGTTPEVSVPDASVVSDVSYPEIGQAYDLSNVVYGTRTAQDAINGANQVHLLTEKFQDASVKLFKLADGSTYTGTLEDLVANGVDLNTVAARVVDANGTDIAWMNANDIAQALSSGVTR